MDVDANDPNAMLAAIPMSSNGAKQPYSVQISLFFAFSRSGVTFESFQQKQPKSSRKAYYKKTWQIRKKDTCGYGLPFVRRVLKYVGAQFLS